MRHRILNQVSQGSSGNHPIYTFLHRHLDPLDALSELLFGLIMVLTFTLGAGLIVKEGPDATATLLLSVVGCNLAWGVIDGVLYVLTSLLERSRKARLLEHVHKESCDEDALALIGQELDGWLAPLASTEERRRLYQAILTRLRSAPPGRTRLKREDVRGSIAIFWLDVVCTIPAVLPFLVFDDRFVALRASNLLLLTTLFVLGFRWARATHINPWLFGSVLLLGGLLLVGIAVALGG
jgi:hypothetical protein